MLFVAALVPMPAGAQEPSELRQEVENIQQEMLSMRYEYRGEFRAYLESLKAEGIGGTDLAMATLRFVDANQSVIDWLRESQRELFELKRQMKGDAKVRRPVTTPAELGDEEKVMFERLVAEIRRTQDALLSLDGEADHGLAMKLVALQGDLAGLRSSALARRVSARYPRIRLRRDDDEATEDLLLQQRGVLKQEVVTLERSLRDAEGSPDIEVVRELGILKSRLGEVERKILISSLSARR